MQNRGVGAGGHDGVVADGVAQLTGYSVERALKDALGARLVERGRQRGEQTVEAMLGGVHGLAHLAYLVSVLDHASLGGELVQLVVGCGVLVRIGETVGLADGLDHRSDFGVGLADHAHTHGTGFGTHVLGQGVSQLGDVVGFDAGHRLHLLETGTRANPVFAVVGGHEEVLGGIVGARRHEQFRGVGLAGRGFGGVGVDRVQDQHGTSFIIGTQAGVVGERGIRAEHVIAIIVAHLRLAGRNDQTFAREGLAQRLKTGGNELGGFERLDLRIVVGPAGLHELLECGRLRAQRAVVHAVAHRLVRARRRSALFGLIFLVLGGDHFTHCHSPVCSCCRIIDSHFILVGFMRCATIDG